MPDPTQIDLSGGFVPKTGGSIDLSGGLVPKKVIPPVKADAPGFFSRLAQSVGLPSSMQEVEDIQKREDALPFLKRLIPHAPGSLDPNMGVTESLARLATGPGAQLVDMATNYGETAAKGLQEGGKQAYETGQELGRGDITKKQALGKTSDAALHSILQATPIIGPSIENAGTDIAQGNYSGAAGGLTGVIGQVAAPELLKRITARPTAPAPVPKSTQALASLLEHRNGTVNVVEAAGDVQPHISNQLAKQGIKASSIKGQNGGQMVVDAATNAIKERGDAISGVMQKVASNPVDEAPIAQAIREHITPELAKNEPGIAARLEAEAAKHDGKSTIGDLNDFRERTNKELDSYYKKGPAKQAVSDVEVRAQESAVRAARQAQYGAMGDGAGVDPAHIQQIMREEGNLIEARNQLSKKYNQAVADHANVVSQTMREKLVGAAGKSHSYHGTGIIAEAVHGTVGMKPLDVLNSRLQTAFKEPGNYQPITLNPNPNGTLTSPAGPTLPGQPIQNPFIKGLLNPAPTPLGSAIEPIENVGPMSQPAAKGLPSRGAGGRMQKSYTTSSTVQRPPVQSVQPSSPDIIPPSKPGARSFGSPNPNTPQLGKPIPVQGAPGVQDYPILDSKGNRLGHARISIDAETGRADVGWIGPDERGGTPLNLGREGTASLLNQFKEQNPGARPTGKATYARQQRRVDRRAQ